MTSIVLLLSLLLGRANAVSSFFNTQSGNWNDGGTWGNASPGVAGTDFPSTGDIPTLKAQTVVTIPVSYSVTPGSITFLSGNVSNPTKLIINGGLTLGGNVALGTESSGYNEIDMGAGATLTLSTFNIILNANGFAVDLLHFLGTSVSHATVSSSGGTFTQGGQGGFDEIDANWTYVDFTGMGDMGLTYGTTGANFAMSHCTWVNSGQLQLPAMRTTPSTSRYVEFSDFRSMRNTIPILVASGGNANHPTGRNEIINTTVATGTVSGVTNDTIQVNASSVAFRNNIFENVAIQLTTSNGLDSWIDGNIFFASTQAISSANSIIAQGSMTVTNNVFYAEEDNMHYWQISTGTHTIQNNFIEQNTVGSISDDGDIYIGGSNAQSSGTVKYNIFVGKRAGAVLLSFLGAATLVENTSMNNNTYFFDGTNSTSHACFSIGESYAGASNMFPSIQNNLCVAKASDAAGIILRDLSAGSASQKITTGNFNAWFNLSGSRYQGTGTYGANDINVNPNFIDSTRDMLSWSTSLGGPGTSADVLNNLLNINGFGGAYNSAYSVSALLTYIRNGFTPRAQQLKGAGFDGSDIGAVSVGSASQQPNYNAVTSGGYFDGSTSTSGGVGIHGW